LKISINAPSYKRPNGVDTLKYLPQTKIWVCESEYDQYKKNNPQAEIILCKYGVQGNLCRIRNHILDTEFKNNVDAVLLIDDDLQYIGYHENKKRCKMDSAIIPDWLIKYTMLTYEMGAFLWGLNCNQDKQSYREYTPFSTTSYIGGPFAVHLPNLIRYDERLFLKEDYDLTLQHLNSHRKVLRLNKFFYVVKQGGSGTGQKGGQSKHRNLNIENEQNKLLQKKWGSKIVRWDFNPRSHSSKKMRKFDINPVVKVPIRGV